MANSIIGIIIMKITQVIAESMIHSAFRATYLTSCEKAYFIEKRDSYSYIMDNEYFINGARIFGCVIFILVTTTISNMIALQYTFILLALIQLMSAFLIQKN